MEQIVLRYWNKNLNIALADWRTVFLLNTESIRLIPEVYKGNLVYRVPKSFKRFSYTDIKKNLVRKQIVLKIYTPF